MSFSCVGYQFHPGHTLPQNYSMMFRPHSPYLRSHLTISQLQADFKKVVESVQKIVQDENKMVALQKSKYFCTVLRITITSDVRFFTHEERRKIDLCTDFRELFFHLRHHWDWDNLVILKYIVNLCDTKEGEQEMVKYERKLALYGGLNLVFDRSRNDPPPGYEDFLIILNKPYNELTVEQFQDAKQFIFDNLDVLQYIAFPYINLLFGSVHFHWHIKVEAVTHMIKMALQRKEIFLKNFYTFMQIGSNVVFDERRQVCHLYHSVVYGYYVCFTSKFIIKFLVQHLSCLVIVWLYS